MAQQIKTIAIKDLVLWTENPRDPINPNATDQKIAERAISSDRRSKWSLDKLYAKMGPRYDQSEIPTVVYIDKKPVVFDGNRRILIGKIIHGHVKVEGFDDSKRFDFPKEIPCNICDEKTALEHIERKHAESGSWHVLERDIFRHKYMGGKKTPLLILEEATRIVSKYPKIMNQRFVGEEIFTESNLAKLGFFISKNQKLKTNYSDHKQAEKIFLKIFQLIKDKEISTRKNRGKIIELIKADENTKKILGKQTPKLLPYKNVHLKPTPVSKKRGHKLFGKDILKLEEGIVNDIYSDLINIEKELKKGNFSPHFTMIIRMGMRLIVEFAAQKNGHKDMKDYVQKNFQIAKNMLSNDEKTTLSCQGIALDSLSKLLHIGAHAYTASSNIEQTIAMSLVIGKMIKITHGIQT